MNISFISAQTNTLKVTSEHPFYSYDEKDWVKVKNFNVGDKFLTSSGKIAIIKNIEKIVSLDSVKVYNLKVGSFSDYFAGDILVHNKDSPKNLVELGLSDKNVQSLSEGKTLEITYNNNDPGYSIEVGYSLQIKEGTLYLRIISLGNYCLNGPGKNPQILLKYLPFIIDNSIAAGKELGLTKLEVSVERIVNQKLFQFFRERGQRSGHYTDNSAFKAEIIKEDPFEGRVTKTLDLSCEKGDTIQAKPNNLVVGEIDTLP